MTLSGVNVTDSDLKCAEDADHSLSPE